MKNYIRTKGQTDVYTFRVLCSIQGVGVPAEQEVIKKNMIKYFNKYMEKFTKKYPKFNFSDCTTWFIYRSESGYETAFHEFRELLIDVTLK